MRKMSSFRLNAPPCWDTASSSSLASRWAIVFSRRWRANSTSQRTASVRARRCGTSTGTWWVAPPTRRERTSSTGVSALIDASSCSIGSLPERSPMIDSASYTMRSAVDFLPSSMTLLITCWTRRERCTGSGSICRIWAAARRGIADLLLLHAVLRAGLLAVGDAGGVERAADDLVADARQVLDATAAHEHDGVLLEVVALARDVRRDLHAIREPHARDLAQRRVRLLRGGRVDAGADAPALRRGKAALAPLAGLET